MTSIVWILSYDFISCLHSVPFWLVVTLTPYSLCNVVPFAGVSIISHWIISCCKMNQPPVTCLTLKGMKIISIQVAFKVFCLKVTHMHNTLLPIAYFILKSDSAKLTSQYSQGICKRRKITCLECFAAIFYRSQ